MSSSEDIVALPIKKSKQVVQRPFSNLSSLFSCLGLLLLSEDVLAVVLRSQAASQDVIEALFRMMRVCKTWHAVINLVIVDDVWLKPIAIAGAAFVEELPLYVDVLAPEHFDAGRHTYEERAAKCEEFYEEMRATQFDEPTQIKGLAALAKIIQAERLHFHGTRATRLLLLAMQTHERSEPLQLRACLTARAVIESSHTIDSDTQTRLVAQLMQVLQNGGAPLPALDAALGALHEILDTTVNRVQFMGHQRAVHRRQMLEAGALPAVVRLAREHLDEGFFATSAAFLSRMAYYHKDLAFDAGVHDLMFARMERPPLNDHWHTCALKTLVNLVWRERAPDIFTEHRMQLLFASLRASRISETHHAGLRLVEDLMKASEIVTGWMLEAGLVSLATDLMQRQHGAFHAEGIRATALRVIMRLAVNASRIYALSVEEVLPQVVLVMRQGLAEESVQEVGVRVLAYICTPPHMQPHQAMPPSVVERIAAALASHLASTNMHLTCSWAFLRVLQNPHNVPVVAEARGEVTILRSMDIYRSEGVIVEYCLRALTCLSKHPACCVYIQERGVLGSALRAMQVHHKRSMKEAAIGALSSFVVDYPHLRAQLRENPFGMEELETAAFLGVHNMLSRETKATARRILDACKQA